MKTLQLFVAFLAVSTMLFVDRGSAFAQEDQIFEPNQAPKNVEFYVKNKKYFTRKMANGGQEVCSFSTNIRKNFKGEAISKVICSMIPGTKKKDLGLKCRSGTDGKSCDNGLKVNPDSPLEACKNVEMAEYKPELEDVLQKRAIVAEACRQAGIQSDTQNAISLLYKPISVWTTPTLPESSKTNDVKTLLDFVVKNGDQTVTLLDQAHQLYTIQSDCFNKRIEITRGQRASDVEELEKNMGSPCTEITEAVIKSYKENLPKVRELLLLVSSNTKDGHSNNYIEAKFPNRFLNSGFDYTPGLSVKPKEQVNAEEMDKASTTYKKWVEEIEQEWKNATSEYGFAEIDRDKGNRARYNIAKAATKREMAKESFPCGKVGTVDARAMQECWEKTFNRKINAKREEAEKELQKILIANPVLQAQTKKDPSDADFDIAYDVLKKRTKEAQAKVYDELLEAKREQINYQKKYAAWKAGKSEEKPSEPNITGYKKIGLAQGTMEFLTLQDPKLCVAAEALIGKRSKKELVDMGLNMGVFVGATIITGGVGGALYGAGVGTGVSVLTGVAGGLALGVDSFTHSRGEREYGRNLLSASFQDEFSGDYVSPGKLEKFLEAKAATEIAKYTIFTPFPQDLVWTKAVFAGQFAALAASSGAAASAVTKNAPKWMGKSGRIDMKVAAGYLAKSQKNGLLQNDGMAGEAITSMMKSIYGSVNPSASEKARTERILEAVYNTTDGRLFKANPVKDPEKFQAEFAQLTRFLQRLREDSFAHVKDDDIVRLVKMLQSGETGFPVNDAMLKEVLDVAHTGLATGKSPEEVFDVIKRFVEWSKETGNGDHLAGLSRVWDQAKELQEQRVLAALKRNGKTERDLQAMSPAERREFYEAHAKSLKPEDDYRSALRTAVTEQEKAAGRNTSDSAVKKEIDDQVERLLGCQRARG